MGNLEEAFALSNKEKNKLTSWAQAGEVTPVTGAVGVLRGRATFTQAFIEIYSPFEIDELA